ncbi:MAG TPA: hypothetical protein VHA74_02975 [Candidatus Dojkabacteria bacterium]|nr:hypothetical protein [Candidatus Dojkabacteria bacterium]
MKKTVFSFLLNIFILNTTFLAFTGIKLPADFIYWWTVMGILSVVIALHKPFLKFLTVKRNFITVWFASAILLGFAMYVLNLFVPGFVIGHSFIKGMDLGIVTIQDINLDMIFTLVISSLLTSCVISVMEFLRSSDSDD